MQEGCQNRDLRMPPSAYESFEVISKLLRTRLPCVAPEFFQAGGQLMSAKRHAVSSKGRYWSKTCNSLFLFRSQLCRFVLQLLLLRFDSGVLFLDQAIKLLHLGF